MQSKVVKMFIFDTNTIMNLTQRLYPSCGRNPISIFGIGSIVATESDGISSPLLSSTQGCSAASIERPWSVLRLSASLPLARELQASCHPRLRRRPRFLAQQLMADKSHRRARREGGLCQSPNTCGCTAVCILNITATMVHSSIWRRRPCYFPI
ncbi:hypothetical protein GALMADRAFT_1047131 [Galerina marginata CBS 339.88]|uniref:Uncharacterized protein n=1 Tax=Galerina marginata (strain CBS 339.88) TaxID=685588 RepID=A0A067SC29_GALM3|nr:hypothetical protein GALMADRAFT_1047131 [Galerina marginata CBS 339.88]